MRTLQSHLLIVAAILCLPTWAMASELSRSHPDLEAKRQLIKSVVLLPPQVEMYEIGAGGSVERMEEWSAAANSNVHVVLETELKKFDDLRVTRLAESGLSPATSANLDETQALFTVVNNSILLHTFDYRQRQFFPEKARQFTYSLGSEIQGLDEQADAFLLVKGFDRRSSGGRKALQAGTMIIGAALGVVAIPRGGGNLMSVALVDAKTGSILWYYRTVQVYDLRESEDAIAFVQDFIKELPNLGRQ
ncbi:MAG: hypothetical protein E6K63_07275 [Nitrospirae bacterium]|nr:MAG: hypothetical protein E6K63_07275 [Nitrospirota bacterium]